MGPPRVEGHQARFSRAADPLAATRLVRSADADYREKELRVSFQFDENGCKVVRDFYAKKLKTIEHDIAFLTKEVSVAQDFPARFALEEALNLCKFQEAYAQSKIREMEHYLNPASAAPESAA